MLAAKIYKGDFLIKKIGLSLNIKVILTIGEDDWFRRKDGTSISPKASLLTCSSSANSAEVMSSFPQ